MGGPSMSAHNRRTSDVKTNVRKLACDLGGACADGTQPLQPTSLVATHTQKNTLVSSRGDQSLLKLVLSLENGRASRCRGALSWQWLDVLPACCDQLSRVLQCGSLCD